MRLTIVPITREEAIEFIRLHHRHNVPPPSWKFGAAASDGEVIRGVVIVGRPLSRHLDDGWTLEIVRCCTDGAPNACSLLYAAGWRAARALGYRRIITYTLDTESGVSLRASGWKVVHQTKAESWSRKARPRVDTQPLQAKLRWEISAEG